MSEAASADRRMIDRVIVFSDAVFAFALTLLALEIRLPANLAGDAELWAQLRLLAPQFGAFLISFALASLWWVVHMAATRELVAFDWPTVICNLLFLFFIVLLPFAAGAFGANITNNAALALYWAVNAGASFAMTLLFFVMSRGKGRLIGGIGPGERALRLLQSVAPGIVFALGAYWALNDQIWLSRFCSVLLAPVYMIAGIIGGMMRRRKARAS
jgi:uncharacterized membrane protein